MPSKEPHCTLAIEIDLKIKARWDAEVEIRSELDHVPWTQRRLATQYSLRTLPQLSKEDEGRINERAAAIIKAQANGHEPGPTHIHKKQKIKQPA